MKPNFHRVTKKAADKCQLQHHFRGGHEKVVSMLEKWAANDPERFVPARIKTIAALCKRYQTKELYGTSWVEKVLRDLRARKIISARVTRWRDYQQVTGFIVADHARVTCRMTNTQGKTVCMYMGWGSASPFELPESNPATAWPTYQADETADDYAGNTADDTAGNPACNCAGHSADDSAETCLDSKEVKPESGDLSFVTVMHPQEPFHPTEPAKPIEPAPLVQAAAQESTPGRLTTSQSVRACALTNGHDVTKPTGREVTTGQRFAIKEDIALLQEISDGEYNVYAYKDDITTLAEYTRMVVEEIAGVLWDNQRNTCAGLMDAVAKRMTRDRKEWPAGWLAVLKELRKGGLCHTQYTPPKPAHWVGRQEHDGPPNAQDAKAHAASEWNMCRDWLCRNAANREADGYTVKAADGVWDKA